MALTSNYTRDSAQKVVDEITEEEGHFVSYTEGMPLLVTLDGTFTLSQLEAIYIVGAHEFYARMIEERKASKERA